MNRALIVGIDSFTGSYLASFLREKDFDVFGTSFSLEEEKVYKCDITDHVRFGDVVEEVEPDYLIYLAGISFPAHERAEDFYQLNTIAPIKALDEVIKRKVVLKKIILVSSSTVYGNQGIEVLREGLCPKPTGHYGASKYAMENLAISYFKKLPIIIARPFNYTGLGQADHFLIPKIVKHFRENKMVIELGNIDVSREFNSVDYVCESYRRLLRVGATSEVVNISSNQGVKLLNVIGMMNEIAGYEIEVKVNPAFVRSGEIKSLTGSTDLLFSIIGKVEGKRLQDTLKEMYEH